MSQTDYFSNETIREDLRGKTVRGGVYVGAAQALCALISLAAVPFLARLLDPADYGLIAMVAVFTNFARMFVDAGLSMATVQQEKITADQVSNLFWIASGLGVLVAIVVACLSPVVAWVFSEPRLIPITLALTLSYVLSGLTIQHQALLRRRMQFRALAVIQVLSVFLSQVAGIAWAWRRYEQTDDYWALVWIPLTAAAVLLVGVWIACPWRPSRPKRGVGTRKMVSFGANLTGFNFVNYFARNADKVLLGWWMGQASLGYYVQAYKILMYPIQSSLGPISGVITPALSRLTEDKHRYQDVYLRSLSLLLLTLSPTVAAIGVTAEWWVAVALGPEWNEVAMILRWLCLSGAIQPLISATGWLYISQGRTKEMLQIGLFIAFVVMLSFAVGLPWGAVGVAASFSIAVISCCLPVSLYWLDACGIFDTRLILRTILHSSIPVFSVTIGNAILVITYDSLSPVTGVIFCMATSTIAWAVGLAISRPSRMVIWDALHLLPSAWRRQAT